MMLASPSSSSLRRSPLLICILVVLVIQSYFLFQYNSQAATPSYYRHDDYPARGPNADPRAGASGTQPVLSQKTNIPIRPAMLHDVVLAIKTGATVIHARVPLQLLTFVPNFPNTLIFSDMKTKIGNFEVADALARVSSEEAGSSLKYWRSLQELQSQNTALSDSDGKMGDLKEGWALDKFKNIPILIDTYQKYPHASYYLFIDGDTSLISSNWWPYLIDLSQKHDPLHSPVYWGSMALLNNAPFGHGGSGYLINQAAIRKLIPEGKTYDESYLKDLERNYTKMASSSCCGDLVLGRAMTERAGVSVKHKWPYYQGETWWSIPYHESNFCREIGTMHHVVPEDMQEIWDFEQAMLRKTGMDKWRPAGWTDAHETGSLEWNFSDMPREAKRMNTSKYKYILFRDMYDWFIAPKMPKELSKDESGQLTESTIRVGWDNRSWKETELNKDKIKADGTEQWKKDAITSEKNCRIACEKHKSDCIQWYYRDGICGLGNKVNYGRRLRNEGTYDEWKKLGVSGWIPSRVEKKLAEWRSKCPGQVV
ncbi:hypothetical protein H072_8407 [Dactylellina haptotyla CBS 200.50]|uniref:Apple domain-containing protein n=1 Tax=Dactylellina haptotyla (strain CBS 200.50) TaxID=1284197 RepID=S8A4G1_DACHA|nr:hypothetical protein H072_8407 [Dactylellina haptotyla CBS 200.50]